MAGARPLRTLIKLFEVKSDSLFIARLQSLIIYTPIFIFITRSWHFLDSVILGIHHIVAPDIVWDIEYPPTLNK